MNTVYFVQGFNLPITNHAESAAMLLAALITPLQYQMTHHRAYSQHL